MSLRIGVIGAGNMARAIVGGVLRADICKSDQIIAADPVAEQRKTFEQDLGVVTSVDNRDAIKNASLVLLATKPQEAENVFESIKGDLESNTLLTSIMAGIATKRIESALGRNRRVVRIMPNTPALVGAGMSALSTGTHATQEDLTLVTKLFAAVGRTLTVPETLFDVVTGLSGSGPAYVFAMIEALRDAGMQEGLEANDALLLASQTVYGAAKLVLEGDNAPEKLRAQVTSKGGTTQAGMAALEQAHFAQALHSAVHAATQRSKELGGS